MWSKLGFRNLLEMSANWEKKKKNSREFKLQKLTGGSG